MDFGNATHLDDRRLSELLLRHTHPYRHSGLRVRVRYSRGADFSGSCYYDEGRIFVNLGRGNRYPYQLATHLAKAQSNATHWWREHLLVEIADAYQLVLFVYLHELYHYLVRQAGRNPKRKESMCDRFAAEVLVREYGCAVRHRDGRPVPERAWRFQDLHAFVARAPKETGPAPLAPREIPVRILGRIGNEPSTGKSEEPEKAARASFTGWLFDGMR